MQDAQPKQSIRLYAIRLHELNMPREEMRLITEELPKHESDISLVHNVHWCLRCIEFSAPAMEN